MHNKHTEEKVIPDSIELLVLPDLLDDSDYTADELAEIDDQAKRIEQRMSSSAIVWEYQ
ncbi:MAG: hypothetical protein R3E01_32905 [Pirellulaceae bacterium]